MGSPQHPDFDALSQQVDLDRLLYASSPPSGPTDAFKPLSVRKIDAGVTHVINARFHHISKPGLS